MFRLEIETSNAAFEDTPNEEIAGILEGVARALHRGLLSEASGHLKDTNGNTVGMWQYTPEDLELEVRTSVWRDGGYTAEG